MTKGYWITTYKSISDMSKVEAYAKLAGPAIEAQGGVYLARGIAAATYEAGIKERTVLSVFPSVEAACAWVSAVSELPTGVDRRLNMAGTTPCRAISTPESRERDFSSKLCVA